MKEINRRKSIENAHFSDVELVMLGFVILTVSCAVGTYFSEGECKPCAEGTYTDTEAQTSCTNCLVGYTTEGPGAQSENECYRE